ncbi:general secretion pathway protein K [Luteibacter jiangsuensis]|uniref:General secretion pathway protein K n=1 Tax=Luteibacter jiangsuensis TaxID=637577 RepID=A0ABT9SU57_9GAMM|nr:type II secretion system protein GspK [Luteibacter jiangsuensis]MDQ0008516.1 general secretion pathway protein K [Luteibacter jiangsuensis]
MKTFPWTMKQRGVALLVVLWGCTLAAITLGALATSARVESTQARGQSLRLEAFYAAEAGIEHAVFMLNAREDTQRWIADGRAYGFRLGRADVQLDIGDEDGKVNLNTASPELIGRLLAASGVDASLVPRFQAAIARWGTRGHMQASLLLAKGGFSSIDELYRVPGISVDAVERIVPFLTLWTADPPNLAHAAPVVVAAVTGAGPEAARSYVDQVRALPPGASALPMLPGTGSGNAAKGFSGIVSITSRARLAEGPTLTLDVTLIMHSEPGNPRPYRIVRWAERSSEKNL